MLDRAFHWLFPAQVVLTAQALVQLVATAATFVEQASVGFLLLAQVMSAFSGYNVLISTMSRVEVSLTYLDFMRWGTQAQYLAAFRDNLCGIQIFNPTSMCAYATVSTQALRLCFEHSTRAIDSSKNQPNRLRFD